MRKIFVDKERVVGNRITVDGRDAYHIKNVLRKQAGDSLLVCASDGNEYDAKILSFDADGLTAEITAVRDAQGEAGIRLTLVQGLPKGEKAELIIQKCSELGVHRLIPVALKNCVMKLEPKDVPKKLERWQRIAVEAAKQCGRGSVMEITAPVSLAEAIRMTADLRNIVLSEHETARSLRAELADEPVDTALYVGAEGGFDPKEIALLTENGAHCVTLGKRILRTETAAIVASGIVMYESGELE